MIVEIISVGTELLLGNIVNTNAKYLAEKCALLGYSMYYQTVVGDNVKRLEEVLITAMNRSDIIITTGGLGPTKDDLTKEVIASVLKKELVSDEATVLKLNWYFSGRQVKDIPENNYKQAMIIEGCKVLENDNGTAPGLIVEQKDKSIILLPGPPNEMIPLFEIKVKPYLMEKSNDTIYSVMVKLCGIGESLAAQIIDDLIEKQTNPTIAPYAKTTEVHLRITAKARDEKTAKELIEPLMKEIVNRLGNYIFTIKEEENLEDVVVKLLDKHKLTCSTAESCTGGLIAGRLTNVPGSSAVFKEGYITYSNESKVKILNIDEKVLNEFGAVSKETAELMARNCAVLSGSDIGIATTGIAGPDGGTLDKPVGLVYIACFIKGKIFVEKYQFKGDRNKIRNYTVAKVIDLMRRKIIQEYE